MDTTPLYPVFSLTLSGETLTGNLARATERNPLTLEKLNHEVAVHKLEDVCLNGKAVSALLDHSRINQDFSIEIAKLIDAELTITISDNKMIVTAEVTPAKGGKPITRADILAALHTEGISSDLVNIPAIDKLLKTASPTIIAQGREVEHGSDTRFIEKFFLDKNTTPTINEKNYAEFFETKAYIHVEAGAELVRRILPTEGTDGITVLGKILPAKKGKLLQFKKYPGTKISEKDADQLCATISGHPVLEIQGARVDPTLALKQANLETGNINFEGSVLINGDVLPQVKISATGDIFVKGTVENANLEAGNSIIIGGGVISESTPTLNEPPKITTQLRAGCDIQAKFLSLTRANAGQNIVIQSYAMNCELNAGHALLLGENGGKGTLIGGHSIAGASVSVQTLGSPAYIVTEVECGMLHLFAPKLRACEALIRKRTSECQQLNKILETIDANSTTEALGEITLNRKKKIQLTIDAIKQQLKDLKEDQSVLQAEVSKGEKATVQASRKLFPQSLIRLNGDVYKEQKERAKTQLSYQAQKIHIE